MCGSLVDQDQEDLSSVQAESGPVSGRLRLGLRGGRQRPRRERGVGEHPAAALPGLHQRSLLWYHDRRVAFGARSGFLRVRRRTGQQRQRGGGHRGDGGGATAAALLRRARARPRPRLTDCVIVPPPPYPTNNGLLLVSWCFSLICKSYLTALKQRRVLPEQFRSAEMAMMCWRTCLTGSQQVQGAPEVNCCTKCERGIQSWDTDTKILCIWTTAHLDLLPQPSPPYFRHFCAHLCYTDTP